MITLEIEPEAIREQCSILSLGRRRSLGPIRTQRIEEIKEIKVAFYSSIKSDMSDVPDEAN